MLARIKKMMKFRMLKAKRSIVDDVNPGMSGTTKGETKMMMLKHVVVDEIDPLTKMTKLKALVVILLKMSMSASDHNRAQGVAEASTMITAPIEKRLSSHFQLQKWSAEHRMTPGVAVTQTQPFLQT